VDRIVALEVQAAALNSDIKDVKKEMKDGGLPVKDLIQEMKEHERMDESDRREARSLRRWAAELLGQPCYFSDDPVPFDEAIDDTQAERAKSSIQRIIHLDTEVKEIKEALKDVFKETKGAGFSTSAVKVIVKMKQKAGMSEKWDEESALVDLYRKVVGV